MTFSKGRMTVCLLHFNPVIVLIRISKENSVVGQSNTTSLMVLNHVLRPPLSTDHEPFLREVSGRVIRMSKYKTIIYRRIPHDWKQLEFCDRKNMLEYNVNNLVKDHFVRYFEFHSIDTQIHCVGSQQNMCSLILL